MRSIRFATQNRGKLRELRELLSPAGIEVLGIEDLGDLIIVEDGDTFADNALKKARAVVERTGEPALADDSGLIVDALGGAPGVHSARYAGVDGEGRDAANRHRLLEALRDVPDDRRAARFVCTLAFCTPDGDPVLCEGTLEGSIGREERGSGGFGYDSIFIVAGDGRTAAELPADEKNRLSHRGVALRALMAELGLQLAS